MHRLHRRDFLLTSLLVGGCLSGRRLSAHEPTGYSTVNLISDIPGLARVTDPAVKDAWGFDFSPEGPFFLVNTNSGVATTYRIDGRSDRVNKVAPDLPIPELAPFPNGGPTDVVYNDTDDFVIGQGRAAGPARYIMSGLDGTLAAWRPGMAAVMVPNNANAVAYTGLALGRNQHRNFIYAANCNLARIDVYDENFKLVHLPPDRFIDPVVPPIVSGYMPFNVQNIGGKLYVPYAQFDGMEEVKVAGHGVVAVFDTAGHFLRNIAVGTDVGGPFRQLNAPWGFAIAPNDFGPYSEALLVGNFGDGALNAFDPEDYTYLGQLLDETGRPLKIDGLWAMGVGNGAQAGSEDKLYFSAGPSSEAHGLFGYIEFGGARDR